VVDIYVESTISAANNGRSDYSMAGVFIAQLSVVDTSPQHLTGHGSDLISLSTKFYRSNVLQFCAIFA